MLRRLPRGPLALASGVALITNLILVWATGTEVFLDGYLARGAVAFAIALLLFRSDLPWRNAPRLSEGRWSPLSALGVLSGLGVGVAVGSLTWAAPGLSTLLAGSALLLWAFLLQQPAKERPFLNGLAAFGLGGRLLLVFAVFLVLNEMGRVYFYLDPEFRSVVPMLFGDGADRTLLSQAIARSWRGLWVSPATWIEIGRPESSFLYLHSDARHLLPQILFFYFFGDEVIASKVITSLVGFASGLLGFVLARRAFGVPTAKVCAALLTFFPTSFAWSLDMMKDPYFALFLMAAVLALFVALDKHRPVAYLLGGAFAFGAFLVRGRWGAALLGALALGLLLVAGSWALGRLRPVGRVLLIVSLLAGSITLVRSPPVQRTLLDFGAWYYEYNRAQERAGGTAFRIWPDRYYEEQMLDFLAEWNLRDLSLAFGRGLYHFWLEPLPGRHPGLIGRAVDAFFVIWVACLVAAGFGIREVWRRKRPFALFLVAYLTMDTLFLVFYGANVFTVVRHRDTLTPLVLLLSGVGASKWLGRLRAHRGSPEL